MHQLLPNHERARNLLIAFRALAAAIVVLIISIVNAYKCASGATESSFESEEEFMPWQIFLSISAIIYGVLLIVCVVLFCMWFRRAYANLGRLGNDVFPSYSDHWAVTGWFVPIINLFRPYQIMREIWNETQWNIPGKNQADIKSDGILSAWWAMWIIANIFSRITKEGDIDPSIPITNWQVTLALISYALTLIALFLVIKVVRQVSEFEKELYETRHEADLSEHLVSN